MDDLTAAVPEWFEITRIDRASIQGVARVRGQKSTPVALTIGIPDRTVSESVPGTVLPTVCPERHINPGSSFCLGRDLQLRSHSDWWAQLEAYLKLQELAAQTRRWPIQHALDHGNAHGFQKAAQRIAEKIGLADEYERLRLGHECRLSPLVEAAGDPDWRLGRLDCFCEAGRVTCNCFRRPKVKKLVMIELSRRKEVSDFWAVLRQLGVVCCGTMRSCELRADISISNP